MLRTQCPACHEKQCLLLYLEPYRNIVPLLEKTYGKSWDILRHENYELRECSKCGLIFQSYVLDDIQYLYSQPTELSQVNEITNYPVHLPEVLNALALLKSPNPKILDYGCGSGDFIKIIKALNIDSFYSEVIPDKGLDDNGIKFINIFDCKVKFDYIYTNQVFEHLNNPFIVLKKLTQLLNDKGIIKIEAPNGAGIKRRIKRGIHWDSIYTNKKQFNQVGPLEHINCFTFKSLANLGKICELKILPSPKKEVRLKRKLMNFLPSQISQINHYLPLNLYFEKADKNPE